MYRYVCAVVAVVLLAVTVAEVVVVEFVLCYVLLADATLRAAACPTLQLFHVHCDEEADIPVVLRVPCAGSGICARIVGGE